MNRMKTGTRNGSANLIAITIIISLTTLFLLYVPQPAGAQEAQARRPINQLTTLKSWQGFGPTPQAATDQLAKRLANTSYTFPGMRPVTKLTGFPNDPGNKWEAHLETTDGYDGLIVALKW